MTEKFTITIDGRQRSVTKGTMLLEVIRAMGIDVPTLCQHASLEPTGACRLCVVEITRADWKGWSGLVTSCLYPVEPGLEVLTRSERVLAARRTLLDMLLARCPDAEAVRVLAHNEGIEQSSFPVREDADKCIMCGLCVRVCQDLGPAAIAPLGRGSHKEVGPRPDHVGEDCTGCGACALVCPTGEIELTRKDGVLSIWNRDFPIAACRVNVNICRGCGVCEEVCPLAIPRVVARRAGTFVSTIAETACVGCGLCAGACPTGAIEQPACPPALLKFACAAESAAKPGISRAGRAVAFENKTVVFACSRSPLTAGLGGNGTAAEEADAEAVPAAACVARVSVDHLIETLAQGAEGILVLGRDQDTCEYGPGEDQVAKRVEVVESLARLVGLGAGRARFSVPPSGIEGPARVVEAYCDELSPSPLRWRGLWAGELAGTAAQPHPGIGLDRALTIIRWLFDHEALQPELPEYLRALFSEDPACENVIYLGDLPALDLLLAPLVAEPRLRTLIEDAAALLANKGIAARPVMTAADVKAAGARRLITFCDCCQPVVDGEIEVVSLAALAGCDTVAAPAGIEPGFRCGISPQERVNLAAQLLSGGAPFVCPGHVAQAMLLRREGAWWTAIDDGTGFDMAFQTALRAASKETVA